MILLYYHVPRASPVSEHDSTSKGRRHASIQTIDPGDSQNGGDSPHYLASSAGFPVLEDGGSAMDAVMWAKAVLTVLNPGATRNCTIPKGQWRTCQPRRNPPESSRADQLPPVTLIAREWSVPDVAASFLQATPIAVAASICPARFIVCSSADNASSS